MKTFTLALGGGGARGLAHIAVIEALDEMGVKPAAIAGTSIGALIGAAYAAGMSGKEMRRYAVKLAHRPGETVRRVIRSRAGGFGELFGGALGIATQLNAEKLCANFLPDAVPDEFDELDIPLTVVATDLHRREEMPISSGPLRRALAASIAIPGLFRPVLVDGRVLIDGGTTNPLPYDILFGRADIVLAVDVFGTPAVERADMPGTWEAVYTTILVMGGAILAAKLAHRQPNVLIRPNVATFRTLDFYQASSIMRTADAVKKEVKENLGALLG
jgi:NTE family protein